MDDYAGAFAEKLVENLYDLVESAGDLVVSYSSCFENVIDFVSNWSSQQAF